MIGGVVCGEKILLVIHGEQESFYWEGGPLWGRKATVVRGEESHIEGRIT